MPAPARMHQGIHKHSVESTGLLAAQARLVQLPGVRDVHPQQRMTRALAWEAAGGEEAGSAGCSLCERGGPAEREVLKRPGRSASPPLTCAGMQSLG